jgi:hypothetical protein
MGTWDVGPFDNDTAGDFCDALDEVAEGERKGILTQTSRKRLSPLQPWWPCNVPAVNPSAPTTGRGSLSQILPTCVVRFALGEQVNTLKGP